MCLVFGVHHIHILHLTTDIGIPVAAAIAADNKTGGRISLGFGASFDVGHATLRALRELRQNELIHTPSSQNYQKHSMQRSHHHWLARATLESNPHFLPLASPPPEQSTPSPTNLHDLLELFAARHWNVCALDLTRPETNTPAVRIIAPNLASPYHRLGSARIHAALETGLGVNPAPFSL